MRPDALDQIKTEKANFVISCKEGVKSILEGVESLCFEKNVSFLYKKTCIVSEYKKKRIVFHFMALGSY